MTSRRASEEAYVKKSLALFATHLRIGIAQDESNGRKEVRLPRTIPSYNHIVPGREGLDDSLLLVAVDPTPLVTDNIKMWGRGEHTF